MKKTLYLHIGADKTGSSAVQTFLYKNAQVLLGSGIHVVHTGLSLGEGHPGLFLRFDEQEWGQVHREIHGDERSHVFVLTWEGIHSFEGEKLAHLKRILSPYDCRIVYVMREQADLIGSAALQRLRADQLDWDIRDDQMHFHWLAQADRDYYRTLGKFSSMFGRDAIVPVLYEPGNMVFKFLGLLGVASNGAAFDFEGFDNPSLTLEGAIAAQMLDKILQSQEERLALRAFLLTSGVQRQGSKNILSREIVERIRSKFARTNQLVAKEWLGKETLFELRECANTTGYDRELVKRITIDVLENMPLQPGLVPARTFDAMQRYTPEMAALQEQLTNVMNSWSWKITSPLRLMRRWLRRHGSP